MRYTVSGRGPSFISAALAMLLALAVQLLAAHHAEAGELNARSAQDASAPSSADG